MDDLTLELLDDPTAFLAAAGGLLAADPVGGTIVAVATEQSVARRAAGETPLTEHLEWWAVLRDGAGAAVGVAMRTMAVPPYPAHLLPMPDAGARLLARTLHDRGMRPGGADGALPATRIFAEETVRLGGGSIETLVRSRLFEARRVRPPKRPDGRPRPATRDDLRLVVRWFDEFVRDIEVQGGRTPRPGARVGADAVAWRVDAGRLWIWEDASGTPVHMTGHGGPALGVARIAPVYTPAAHRGRGYAAALVAETTQRFLDDGVRVCLFTDLDNPVSNRLYQSIGYEPVADQESLQIHP